MIVTFISECEKKATSRTRRVLDSFANRIGTNTWQTVITEEGLQAVYKLLKKTATKNTAVSCHRIKSRIRTDLIWIVGNRQKFNYQGYVPVNITRQGIESYKDKHQWKTLSTIKHASAVAALFHDFGKANKLFQKKIGNPETLEKKQKIKSYEPYRHEWVSLRLFESFVKDKTDLDWLGELSEIEKDTTFTCFKDGTISDKDKSFCKNNPLKSLPPFAQLVAWLILTHHRLPLVPKWESNTPLTPDLKESAKWMSDDFEPIWNSYKCKNNEAQEVIEENWKLSSLPTHSAKWRAEACQITSSAHQAFKTWGSYNNQEYHLNDQVFTEHISRLCLMLADHHYSAQDEITPEWRSRNYDVFANTYPKNHKKTRKLKQQLDEHCIGVAYHCSKISLALPKLEKSLPSLEKNKKEFIQKVLKKHKKDFGWQDEAVKLAETVSKNTASNGFFGMNMASTGKGKTLGNIKIMYALLHELGRIRISYAIGLRSLTLQTGKEFKKELLLSAIELAILVGGASVKELFENEQNKEKNEINKNTNDGKNTKEQFNQIGSESLEEFFDENLVVEYEGTPQEHSLSKWTAKKESLEHLIQAPVLVSTIDHLMPATEGVKGGKQIAPMLRLLTSDLILDEPDDYGLEDLPALCRLVHWAGLLGSRVLLSTATMPPSLVLALYQAYSAGWSEYAKANIDSWDQKIICAWFDENHCQSDLFSEHRVFKKTHKDFVSKRIQYLQTVSPKRKARIAALEQNTKPCSAIDAISLLSKTIQENILKLHQNHSQELHDKQYSIGLVRMANIPPLVAVAKELLILEPQESEDTCIYYCVYHSNYPLAIRSYLESKLDSILNRKNNAKSCSQKNIWKEHVEDKINNNPQKHHIFVVLASPVAEVGRDHDYDWGIIEPSSMRSIIQIAGRVLRHREIQPSAENIVLLNQNYKTLIGKSPAFVRPGFETEQMKMASYDLNSILIDEQFKIISAISRIEQPETPNKKDSTYLNLVDLEHCSLKQKLFGKEAGANLWWKMKPYWCGEMQRQSPFRKSNRDEPYYLWIDDENSPEQWKWKNEQAFPPDFGVTNIEIKNIDDDIDDTISRGNFFWFDLKPKEIYSELEEDFKIYLSEISKKFGEVRFIVYNYNLCFYHRNLGVHQKLGDEL